MEQEKKKLGLRVRRGLFAAGVAGLCAATLSPFAAAIAWGAALAVAMGPLARRASQALGSPARGALAVVASLAVAVGLPLGAAIAQAATQLSAATGWIRALGGRPWPSAPDWLAQMPMVGAWASNSWASLGATAEQTAMALGKAHGAQAAAYAASVAGGVGALALHACLSLAVAWAALAKAEPLARELRGACEAAFGPDAPQWLDLGARAARGVALGVFGTALAVSSCAALGLAAAGIPAASLWFCACMALCLAQIGALPVLLPAAGYLAMQGRYGAASFVALVALATSVVDGVMRPYLIGREIKMPMALIFAGVVGGLIAFGMLGMFIGPMALAMGMRLWEGWRQEARAKQGG